MPTARQLQAMNLYAGLMQEIKIRFQSIDFAVNGGMQSISPNIIQEFGFLQLRFICELIAFGCLVAHGDIRAAQAPRLIKEYAADKIIQELDRLHPKFFPRPVTISPTPEGFHTEDREANALTKTEIATLYGRCGNFLHRGNLKKMLSATAPLQVNFPEIAKWTNKIVALLDTHHIASFDNRLHFFCQMLPPGQPVSVALAESPPPLETSSDGR